MSDYGDMCREIRKHNQLKRACEYSKNMEKVESIMYETEIKNNGHHVVIKAFNGKIADYWPSSDKYHIRKSGQYKHGFKSMMSELAMQG